MVFRAPRKEKEVGITHQELYSLFLHWSCSKTSTVSWEDWEYITATQHLLHEQPCSPQHRREKYSVWLFGSLAAPTQGFGRYKYLCLNSAALQPRRSLWLHPPAPRGGGVVTLSTWEHCPLCTLPYANQLLKAAALWVLLQQQRVGTQGWKHLLFWQALGPCSPLASPSLCLPAAETLHFRLFSTTSTTSYVCTHCCIPRTHPHCSPPNLLGKYLGFHHSRCSRCPRRNEHGHFLLSCWRLSVCLLAPTCSSPNQEILQWGPVQQGDTSSCWATVFSSDVAFLELEIHFWSSSKPQTPSFCHIMVLVTHLDLSVFHSNCCPPAWRKLHLMSELPALRVPHCLHRVSLQACWLFVQWSQMRSLLEKENMFSPHVG